jgi:hypothetical protein
MHSLLHCHFESALRALELARPERVRDLRQIYTSDAYVQSTPAGRLTLLWQTITRLTDNEDIFTAATFREDQHLPADVLDTYTLLPVDAIAEHHDPIASAMELAAGFRPALWSDLYAELVGLVGAESVGIFGSSMFGLHLTREGTVRKDVDFVIEGLGNVGPLRKALPGIRARLGFTAVSPERQRRQYQRYQRIFRNDRNSTEAIIARRWTGLQLSDDVVTTIRIRDPSQTTAAEVVAPMAEADDAIVSGRVTSADSSNLFPRRFDLTTRAGIIEIYILWWKFSTPVRDGDLVTLSGSMLPDSDHPVIRLTNYSRHWLRIHD